MDLARREAFACRNEWLCGRLLVETHGRPRQQGALFCCDTVVVFFLFRTSLKVDQTLENSNAWTKAELR